MGICCSSEERHRGFWEVEDEEYEDGDAERLEGDRGAHRRLHGSCRFASMHTQQGKKGINQDAMTIWEDFNGEKDTIFCSVFDGHGPLGHKVACHVRDVLPSKLSEELRLLKPNYIDDEGGDYSDACDFDFNDDDDDSDDSQDNEDTRHVSLSSWKARFAKVFHEMDEELNRSPINCVCSGATAVSILKQGDHLTIANLGDSRAILCTRDSKDQPLPIPLTVDLKPNLPTEAERIKRCRGRVFALDEEPDVYRIWLPDDDSPGLAMARAFGDFCLKDYGLIAIPQVSYRKITEKDEFIVLATDGVWDVLSNKEVVKIVASAGKRSMAAELLVARAVRAWKYKYPTSKIDDCAAICLFLKAPLSSKKIAMEMQENNMKSQLPPVADISRITVSDTGSVRLETTKENELKEEWSALEGVSRVNSLLKLPRFSSVMSWRKRSKGLKDGEDEAG
ncbi:hypothetical protein MRB53_000696 [Persea americana]|uniref:Uncharacterized protein n=1 Tax=Persea americana TaxID=3435 RepID=A0ACC2MQA1_PERAE|nr:hypothetical protein MRB53_000696 [Persea americana]